jgi:hypothetical protein
LVAYASFSIDDLDCCLAGANAVAPDLMNADERLTEVAQILAAGLVRLRQLECRRDCRDLQENSLDSSPVRSVHATARQRRGVRR